MNDWEEIRQLAARMAWYFTGEPLDIRELWTRGDSVFYDMTGIGGPRVEGSEALIAFLENAWQGSNPLKARGGKRSSQKVHILSNHVIQISGKQATGRCAAIGFNRGPDGTASHAATSFKDAYVRTPVGWRFQSREASWLVAPDWALRQA